jgi:Ion channel
MNLRDELIAIGLPIPADIPIDRWVSRLGDAPCQNTLALVGLSALVFYAAEKHHNPKVNDIFDAAIYTSTCLSVGYGDIFAKTPIGKILGSVLMALGPAFANASFDGRIEDRREPMQEQILDTLRQILARLPVTRGPEGQSTSQATPET